jgi:hypothetical protein
LRLASSFLSQAVAIFQTVAALPGPLGGEADVPSVSCLVIGQGIVQAEVASLSYVRAPDQGPQRVDRGIGRAPSLLEQAPRDHAGNRRRAVSARNGDRPHDPSTCPECAAELVGLEAAGDLGSLDGLDGVGRFCGPGWMAPEVGPDADLGDIVVILLVSTLAGLRDRLHHDGYEGAASLVHDLVEVADDYVMRLSPEEP